MKEIKFTSSVVYESDYGNLKDLSIRNLCDASVKAIDNAYAPYSNYHVGASVLLESGKLVMGNNQENAVYPLGLCEERVALFNASSLFPNNKVVALAVATEKELSDGRLPPFPCGSCRQVILEIEQRYQQSIPIYVIGSDRSVCIINSVKDILPFAFDVNSL